MSDTHNHVLEEETELLPAFQAKCTQQELVELGDKFQSQIVTTRPVRQSNNTNAQLERFGRS